MLGDFKSALFALGLGVLIAAAIAYLLYMIGLILVLKRMNKLTWMAFVPLLNYYAQIRAVNAPPRWFAISLIPYVGAVYSAAVAIRLGRVFGRGPAFSLTWLIFGAPIGMFVIYHSRAPLHLEILDEPAELIDLKHIRDIKA